MNEHQQTAEYVRGQLDELPPKTWVTYSKFSGENLFQYRIQAPIKGEILWHLKVIKPVEVSLEGPDLPLLLAMIEMLQPTPNA